MKNGPDGRPALLLTIAGVSRVSDALLMREYDAAGISRHFWGDWRSFGEDLLPAGESLVA
jgi:hypothetical protein